jgi:hypothetical protein
MATRTETNEEGGARLDTPAPSSSFFNGTGAPTNGYTNGSGYGNNGYHSHSAGPRYHQQPAWAEAEPEDDDTSCGGGETPIDGVVGTNYVNKTQAPRPQFDRQCTRTIQLLNLAEGTTHADIASAVRGGLLLDVFIRGHERTATVSFLHALDARAFFDHVRKHDLYIKNKRVGASTRSWERCYANALAQVDVKWADRQFILPGHVAGKIAQGATRNLVLRRYDARHNEDSIREDLDHIHNLVVVKVDYIGSDCCISLNSVHNAIYARMCMMSRLYVTISTVAETLKRSPIR